VISLPGHASKPSRCRSAADRWPVGLARGTTGIRSDHRWASTGSDCSSCRQPSACRYHSCFQQHTAPVTHRVAATLLLLYAQPVTRISRLQTTDISDTGNDMAITLDTDAVPRPPTQSPSCYANTSAAGRTRRQRPIRLRRGCSQACGPANHSPPTG